MGPSGRPIVAGAVAFPFPVTEALEGRARLLVPDVPRRKGPGAKGPWPFYNPTMAVSRDVSAVVLARWPGPLDRVLDGLAATGAWGIRMALEGRARGLVLNDASPMARALLLANAARHGAGAGAPPRERRAQRCGRGGALAGPPRPPRGVVLRLRRRRPLRAARSVPRRGPRGRPDPVGPRGHRDGHGAPLRDLSGRLPAALRGAAVPGASGARGRAADPHRVLRPPRGGPREGGPPRPLV